MNVRLIAITKPADDLQEDHGIWTAEDLIVYAARVSNGDLYRAIAAGYNYFLAQRTRSGTLNQ